MRGETRTHEGIEHATAERPRILTRQPTGAETLWLDKLSPEKKSAGEQLLAAFEAFADERGTPGVERLTQTLNQEGAISPEHLARIEKEVPARREFQTALWKSMQNAGYLELTTDGSILVDVERLKQGRFYTDVIKGKSEFENRRGKTARFSAYIERGVPEMLFEAFKDARVLSKEDIEQGAVEPKPLFYVPENQEAAFDPEQIKNAEFQMGFWELSKLPKRGRDVLQPGLGRTQLNEVAIAAMIFHPNYGDGYKDENGVLMVKDNNGTYGPVNSRWFIKTMQYWGGDPNESGGSLSSPREYIPRYAPRVLEHGVLKLDDFTAVATGVALERRVERKGVSKTGTVIFRGVLHYLGREFIGAPIRVHEISPGIGGITKIDKNGKETVTHTFTLYSADDQRVPEKKFGKNRQGKPLTRKYAGAELTQVQPYTRELFFKRREGEDDETYQTRLQGVDNFESVLGISHLLWKEARVNLANLPYEEQAQIASVIPALSSATRRELPKFAGEYGLDGLRTLVSAVADTRAADDIFRLAEKLGPPAAKEIFRRYAGLLNTARDNADTLAQMFLPKLKRPDMRMGKRIRGELIKHAQEVLNKFSRIAQNNRIEFNDIVQELNHTQEEVFTFASFFKYAKQEDPQLQFEDVEGVSLKSFTARDIEKADQREMKEILSMNWQSYPEDAQEEVMKGLNHALATDGAKFYLLRKDDVMLGFARFEPRPNGNMYAGSFNMRPEILGSAIGSAMAKAILDKESQEHTVEVEVYERTRMLKHYVRDFGFEVTGELMENGEKIFKLERKAAAAARPAPVHKAA